MSLFKKHSLKVLNKEFADYASGKQTYEQIAAKLDLPVARPLKKGEQNDRRTFLCDYFKERFYELSLLQDGFLDGEGEAFDKEDLKWNCDFLCENYPEDIELPRIYPTLQNSLSLEWSNDFFSTTLEIELDRDSGKAYLHILDIKKDCAEELKLYLYDDWDEIKKRLKLVHPK